MNKENVKTLIEAGKAVVGIELGSTRIKAVMIDENHQPVATGSYDWENRLDGHIWTYDLEDIWKGLKASYANMAADVKEKYGTEIKSLAGIGFSAMMHGYMAFDKEGTLLVPFRTWRNTITGQAAEELTELFQYNIPQRWSIAHLYQAILNKEEHVKDVAYFTTLSGYIHWQLTGQKVLGVGDASGMFPIDPATSDFYDGMIEKFDKLVEDRGYSWKLREIMPKVLCAGDDAGCLTEEGVKLLDPTGTLQAGIPVCPPEGDAGTGMIATNSVAKENR
jgi:Sugar (pentulose and hexulose) kinases